MLPAFLLAGAVAAFIPAHFVLRYLGGTARKRVAYSAAAISGVVLSLCSCNVVPLFVSIYRRGAGIGPAFTFLYAGPALSLVTAVFTFQVIGVGEGLWRLISVLAVATAVGGAMAIIYRKEEGQRQAKFANDATLISHESTWRIWPLFGLLLGMIVYGGTNLDWRMQLVGMVAIAGVTGIYFAAMFTRADFKQWMWEFWCLIKLIIPLLIVVLIIIAVVAKAVPLVWVHRLLMHGSGDTLGVLRATLFADIFGSLMYFPVLTEIAFVKAFLKENMMSIGPAMAILLTGPGFSLAGALIVSRSIGWRKVIVYMTLVVTFTTLSALLYVSEIGQYICACMRAG